jgi:hypothetical protein
MMAGLDFFIMIFVMLIIAWWISRPPEDPR